MSGSGFSSVASQSAAALGRSWAEIDLGALGHNLAAVRAHLGSGVGIMAIVKANAYGHGVIPVVRALHGRVEMFGVANVTEARELLTCVAPSKIFILGPALPEERAEIVADGFVPAVSSVEEAAAYSVLAPPGAPIAIHLTIDTGMGRIGIWQDDVLEAVRAILALPGVVITGLASHLPVADEDDAFTREEIERFHALVGAMRVLGVLGVLGGAGSMAPCHHVANSAGIIGFPDVAGDMVRAGLMLYGSAPRPEFQQNLRAVLTWKTRVTLVREVGAGRGISYGRTFITPQAMRIATLAVGYADGYQRHLSGRGADVLIGGCRCPVLGRITMDQILVDVSALPKVAPGDEVVLIGRQGEQEILAAELAEKSGTIAWEIFTGIGARIKRTYV